MRSTTIGDTIREAVGPNRRQGRAGPRWIAVALLTAFALAFVAYKAFTRPHDAAGLPGHESYGPTYADPGSSPGSTPYPPLPAAPAGTRGD